MGCRMSVRSMAETRNHRTLAPEAAEGDGTTGSLPPRGEGNNGRLDAQFFT